MRKKKYLEAYSNEGERINILNIFPDYPNPIFQRAPFINLNGRYKFVINKSKLIPNEYEKEIIVPFPIESLLSNIHQDTKKKRYYHFHKDFDVSKDFDKDHIFLNFLRLNSKYEIFINGKLIYTGEDESNLIIDIKDAVEIGSNTLDLTFTKTKSEFLGITGQVYLDSAGLNYINNVFISTDLFKQTVSFTIDTLDPNGTISIIGPNGIEKSFEYHASSFTLPLSDIVPWSPEKPFFYQYKLVNSSDSIKGAFNLATYSKGISQSISCLMINDSPISIKGIIDDYYYSDGFTTFPSIEFLNNEFMKVRLLGFNAIYKKNMVDLPMFYYLSLTRGLMIAQELEYTTDNKLLKDLEYLSSFGSIFLIVINSNSKEKTLKDIYLLAKKNIPGKLVVAKHKFKSYGDMEFLFKYKEINKLRKNKNDNLYLLNNLSFKNESLENLSIFMKEKYMKSSMNGLSGFFYSSLKNPANGIYNISLKKLRYKKQDIIDALKIR